MRTISAIFLPLPQLVVSSLLSSLAHYLPVLLSVPMIYGNGKRVDSYRLAPADGPLTEENFGKLALDFVGNSTLRWDGDRSTQITFNTTAKGWETNVGTIPAGSMWRKNPIPSGLWQREGPSYKPVCEESQACLQGLAEFRGYSGYEMGVCKCSGWSSGPGSPLLPNLEVVDTVLIPKSTKPGKYVLQWRWDCEESDQIWASCSDVTIAA